MMGGMYQAMLWISVLTVFVLLGFAYIVWVLSSKETGAVKIIGQIISMVIAVIVIVLLIYGSLFGGTLMGNGSGHQPGMMRMMGVPDDKTSESCREMTKNPERHQMLQKRMGEKSKQR